MSGPQFLPVCTGVFNMTLPSKGPIAIPVDIDYTVSPNPQDIDFSYLINNGQLDFISGVYLGEPLDGELSFICAGTKQVIIIPVGVTGYFPMMVQNPAKVNVSFNGTPDIIHLLFYNFPQYPFAVSESGAGTAVTIANGADVAEGNTGDAAYVDNTGAVAGTVISLLKGMYVALKGFISVTISPIRTDATSHSGTITLGGTAQDLMAANANRNGWSIQNQSGDYLYVRSKGAGGATVATPDQNSIRLSPGQLYESPYVSPYAISIYGATTGDAFWSREW